MTFPVGKAKQQTPCVLFVFFLNRWDLEHAEMEKEEAPIFSEFFFLVCHRSGHKMRWWHRQRPWFHSPFLGWKWGCCMNWIEELGVVRFGNWLGIHHQLTMLSLRELFHVEFKMGDSGGTVSVVLDRFPFVEVATRHVLKTHCTVIPWGAGRYSQGLLVWGGFGSELDSQSYFFSGRWHKILGMDMYWGHSTLHLKSRLVTWWNIPTSFFVGMPWSQHEALLDKDVAAENMEGTGGFAIGFNLTTWPPHHHVFALRMQDGYGAMWAHDFQWTLTRLYHLWPYSSKSHPETKSVMMRHEYFLDLRLLDLIFEGMQIRRLSS